MSISMETTKSLNEPSASFDLIRGKGKSLVSLWAELKSAPTRRRLCTAGATSSKIGPLLKITPFSIFVGSTSDKFRCSIFNGLAGTDNIFICYSSLANCNIVQSLTKKIGPDASFPSLNHRFLEPVSKTGQLEHVAFRWNRLDALSFFAKPVSTFARYALERSDLTLLLNPDPPPH